MRTGEIIKSLIKAKGLKQAEFCDMIGITVAGFRMQIDRPSYPTLERYAKYLNVPLWRLFATEDEVKDELISRGVIDDPETAKRKGFVAFISNDGRYSVFDDKDAFKQFAAELQ